MSHSSLKSFHAHPGSEAAANPAEAIVSELFDVANHSSSLIAGQSPVTIGGQERAIPRFLLLGQRGGGTPIRVALFGGLDGGATETTAALSRLLLQYELVPGHARDYAIFAYPIVSPTSADLDRGEETEFPVRYAEKREDADVHYVRQELETWRFDGVITLRTDDAARGFYAKVRHEVLAREVVLPALAIPHEAFNVPVEAVTLDERTPFALGDGGTGPLVVAPKGRAPYPFEIEIFAPAHIPWEQRTTGLFLVVQQILRNYRKLISHAANL